MDTHEQHKPRVHTDMWHKLTDNSCQKDALFAMFQITSKFPIVEIFGTRM